LVKEQAESVIVMAEELAFPCLLEGLRQIWEVPMSFERVDLAPASIGPPRLCNTQDSMIEDLPSLPSAPVPSWQKWVFHLDLASRGLKKVSAALLNFPMGKFR
jgi:hypothetical protein